ncbi:uncharacterized protein [Halyomorpha halys]|uniref:uncharacterized protein n=1 Tax=Halyomorpha halys TaxID=286706 RepID=UPI0006D51C42|nr:uncharacterized protein LOC106682473 [Halyomorpha halys]XP_024214105.1 uncharacterized protein LOC106682473 [Halyomorpha halys]
MTCSVTMKWPKLLEFVLFWICIPDLSHSEQQALSGPFRVLLHEIVDCDEKGTHEVYASGTKITKVSRSKYVYSTNITTKVDLDDSMTAVLECAIFEDGAWRPHFLTMEFPTFCTSMKQVMPVIYKAMVQSMHSECPYKAGTYEINDLDMDSYSMPNFPYGKYRTDVSGKINGTLVGCIRYFADVVPAKSGRQQKKPRNNS